VCLPSLDFFLINLAQDLELLSLDLEVEKTYKIRRRKQALQHQQELATIGYMAEEVVGNLEQSANGNKQMPENLN